MDSLLTDISEVSLTRRPRFILQEDSWYSLVLDAEPAQDCGAVGRIRPIEKSNDFAGNRTCDLPACSIVSQPTILLRTQRSVL
jgi:hypothetical protein